MRAAVLTEPGEFALEERPRPEPGPTEVLVALERVGICGSDVHYYDHGRIGDYVVEDPLVLGHESAGVVADCGEAVTDLEPGDRVTLEPGIPCRRCEHCSSGHYNRCPEVTFMATPPHDGAFVEYLTWPADFVYRLPDSVSLAEGALCEPLSVCLHVCERAGVGVGDSVLVTGAGPIGLLAMAVARVRGATEVYVADVLAAKLERALERGADGVVNVADDDLETAVDAWTDGRGVDVVIEASGAPSAIQGSLGAVRTGGTVAFVGLAPEAEIPLDVLEIVTRELDVVGTMRFANTYQTAVSLLADGRVDVAGLIDFEAPLAEVTAAFERSKREAVVKGMLTVG
ncbi:NAD(P)-dependent alcohol dehydrogenase [Natronobiforma cellulositropha]|uniref:NAD(P)-dependent alcohol dehydrogenase n=1 Tax=Natronobiforma cellulositropha TaxID=1679076 RepID=UPI003CCE3199